MANVPHEEKPTEERPTETKAKRSDLRLRIALVVVALFYPVIGTLALSSGLLERFLESEDLRIEIDKPAWTVLPGRVHMAGARILVNGETQFDLSAKDLLFHVRLLSLAKKHLYVTSFAGEDVHYKMRVQVDSTEGIEDRLAAYPELPELPGDPTVVKGKAQDTEEREGDFTVQVANIDVKVSELWFMEYRYVGDGTLQGGFLVGPQRMHVDTSVQELGPGEVRFGADRVIIDDFEGRIETEIPEINPEEHADESFLELVDADITLKGNIRSLSHLTAYLTRMKVSGGAGPFETRLVMSKGYLGDPTRFKYETDEVKLQGSGYGVATDLSFQARMGDGANENKGGDGKRLPHLTSASKTTYVSFSNDNADIFTVQLHDHEHNVVLKTPQLGKMTDIRHASLRFPKIVSHDMKDLAALTSNGAPVSVKEGTAKGSLSLDIDENHVVRGPFEMALDGMQVDVEGVRVQADGKIAVRLNANLDDQVTSLEDFSIALSDVGVRVGDERIDDWWFQLASKRIALWGLPPSRVETRFAMRAKDLEPVLETLAEKDEISDLIPKLTKVRNLRLVATVRRHGDTMDVVFDPLESRIFDVAGRFHSSDGKNRFAFVVGGKAISLGIAKNRTGLRLMPFAKEGWLNEQLRSFPKPVEQVAAPAP